MNKIADIKLPSRMSPALARAVGDLITSVLSDRAEVGPFLSLCLMNQSWLREEPCSLQEYLLRIRVNLLSLPMSELFSRISSVDGVQKQVSKGLASSAAAEDACRYIVAMANRVALHDTGQYVMEVQQMRAKLDKLKVEEAPQLFNQLRGEVEYYSPETAALNEDLYEKPGSSAGSDIDGNEPVTVLVGNDGQPIGFFRDEKAAMEFLQMQQAVQRRLAELSKARGTSPQSLLGLPETIPTTIPQGTVRALQEGRQVRVFDPAAVRAHLERLPKVAGALGQAEGNAQQRALLAEMANDSGMRKLNEVPADNPLAALYQRFPHFSDVLDFISRSLALAACGDDGKVIRVPPILLRGSPGTGKTRFAQDLARVLQTQFVERDLSVSSEAWVISGMDSAWKGSRPGIVFDSIVTNGVANPLILLNEVDKCKVSGMHNSPLSAMYALLEPTSAAAFVDEFAPIPIDASRVIWILTANDGHIPDPVLSRLEVFDVREPTQEECRAIAQSVWASICSEVMPSNHGFETTLSEELVDVMSAMSPRLMRKTLTAAAGNAAFEGKKVLDVEDVQKAQGRYAPPKRSMGFVGSN